MKQLVTYAFCIILTTGAVAQEKITVQNKSESLGGGSNPALVVMIYEASKDQVEKDWKSELKKMGGKIKMGNEIFCDDASDKGMGDNTFDMYSKVRKVGDKGVEVALAVDLGGAFMTSGQHGAQWKYMEKKLYDFAVRATKDAIGNQVKQEEKVLTDLNKEQEKLVKNNEDLNKEIEDNKKKIKEAEEAIKQAEENIKTNEKDQETKKGEIEVQTKVVEEIKTKMGAVK